MFRTMVSVIVMVIAAFVGLFAGAFLNDVIGGMILFALIAGIACIVHALANKNTQ